MFQNIFELDLFVFEVFDELFAISLDLSFTFAPDNLVNNRPFLPEFFQPLKQFDMLSICPVFILTFHLFIQLFDGSLFQI